MRLSAPRRLTLASVVSALLLAAPAHAEPVKNIVLVHGAWVDASGWKPVYDILREEGHTVTMVQIPETSFQDDVAHRPEHSRTD